MKTDVADLALISMVIDTEGFKIVEDKIRKQMDDNNDVVRVTGNPFQDGGLVGFVEGHKSILQMFWNLRKEIREMNNEDK